MKNVLFGIDQFCSTTKPDKNVRIGLVTNDVAKNAFGVNSRVALIDAGFQVVKLFSPEHGLSAKAADGAWVPNKTDGLTNLPVVSLYGDNLRPSEEDLHDVDAIVFDIPDVGCRFYTYLWTMTHIMEACAEHHKEFIVLDRPNPLSGDLIKAEGPLLDSTCSSFIGRWNIPIRHSCTLGELANYFASKHIPNLDLQVVKIHNWNRKDLPNQGNWDFEPTSPAIKDSETALLYPGLGLLEGINVNEGRGTGNEFKVLGAPWIDATSLKANLDNLNLPGISFSEIRYTPDWGLYKGEVCFGLSLNITNAQTFRPVSLGIEILKQLITEYPTDCKKRLYKTNANPNGVGHLDKLMGVHNSFQKLKKNLTIKSELRNDEWQEVIEPSLIY